MGFLSFTPLLNGYVLVFFPSHPIYDQTQGSGGVVFSFLCFTDNSIVLLPTLFANMVANRDKVNLLAEL
jgi:hypothetical protein